MFELLNISDNYNEYKIGREALDNCWNWLEGGNIEANDLCNYIDSEDYEDIMEFADRAKNTKEIYAWYTALYAIAYTTWQAYRKEDHNYPPQIVESVDDETLITFVDRADFKMKINDGVFGELEYDYVWSRDTTIEFCGKEADIALMIDGEEDGEFSEKQYASYNSLIQNWGHLQQSILQPILDYYKQKRPELGYNVSYNENYPLIETIDQLLERIRLVGIYVPSARRFEGRYIGLTFDCTWDIENGIGIRLINEEVARIGYQDVAI